MLSAALGNPDAITVKDLERPDVRETVRTLLSGDPHGGLERLARRPLSEGLDQGVRYEGMWNYEAVIAETNQKLKERGAELLYAIYPTDGVAFANSSLGFVDRGGGDATRKFFEALQAHLLSRDVQASTRRTIPPSRRRRGDCRQASSRTGIMIHAIWLR